MENDELNFTNITIFQADGLAPLHFDSFDKHMTLNISRSATVKQAMKF